MCICACVYNPVWVNYPFGSMFPRGKHVDEGRKQDRVGHKVIAWVRGLKAAT